MVKSETRRDAETLVRNPSPTLFGKEFRDSKKVKTNHAKTRLRDLQKRFRDFEILLKFSETHVFRGTIRHPFIATIAYLYLPYLSAFNVSLSDTNPQKSSISSQ